VTVVVSGVLLVAAFGVATVACAWLLVALYRVSGRRAGRDPADSD
jgi:hypothetical protein